MSKLEGFRLPAEWESQEAVWFSWPVSDHIWSDHRSEVWAKISEIVAQASYYEPVRINARKESHDEIRDALNRAKADLHVIELWDHETNDVWCRDHGPIFLKKDSDREVIVSDWKFNAWGEKFEPFDADNRVPTLIANSLGLERVEMDSVLEGGAIESDGAGCLLTTKAVLLNENRYAQPTLESQTDLLKSGLGIDSVIWLENGIQNDDTDGHIDNITRFFAPGKVVTAASSLEPTLAENRCVLEKTFSDVVNLPLPESIRYGDEPLPASYLNFLILNDAVLLPVFGQRSNDDFAMGVLADCFPGRKIVPIDSRVLLLEGGAIHCMSMQQPAVD